MNDKICILFLFTLLACNNTPVGVIITMMPEDVIWDTTYIDDETTVLTGYYSCLLENNSIFDTISLPIDQLRQPKNSLIQPSSIMEIKKDGEQWVDLINHGYASEYARIPKGQSKKILIELPRFEDSTTTKEYVFYVDLDSAGVRKPGKLKIKPIRNNIGIPFIGVVKH